MNNTYQNSTSQSGLQVLLEKSCRTPMFVRTYKTNAFIFLNPHWLVILVTSCILVLLAFNLNICYQIVRDVLLDCYGWTLTKLIVPKEILFSLTSKSSVPQSPLQKLQPLFVLDFKIGLSIQYQPYALSHSLSAVCYIILSNKCSSLLNPLHHS